eukprot:187828_1
MCKLLLPEETPTTHETPDTQSTTINVTPLTTMIQTETTEVSLPQKGRSIANEDSTIHDLINIVERETLIDEFIIASTDSTVTTNPVPFVFPNILDMNGIKGTYSFPQSILDKNKVIRSKIENFKYMRADVEIRVLINNNPFMAGMLGLHYAPYLFEIQDSYQQNLSAMGLTSLPTTFLNTELANTMTMRMPFINERDYFDLTATQHSFGTTVLTNWGIAKSENSTIKVQVYARFVNTKLLVPTNKGLSYDSEYLITAQSGENEYEGPITQASGAIGKLGSLAGQSGIPVISTIGKVTSWVSRAVGAVAGHFGWSKPVNLSHPQHVERTPGKGYTHTLGTDGSVSLGTIPDNSIDCQDANPSTEDEMVISSIISRPNYFQKMTWSKSDTFGAEIGHTYHSPNKQVNYFWGTFSYVCAMFQYWRGTIRYHFRFIKTKYHMGRLIFVYFPSGVPSSKLTTEITTNYTCIVDLNEINSDDLGSGEFTLDIPYMASTPWSVVDGRGGNSTIGVLGVYVSVPLDAPTTCSDSIDIWVGHSGTDSFELAIPTSNLQIVAQAGDERTNTMGTCSESPDMNATVQCIGERVDSLRPLVKRFTPNSFNGRIPALKAGVAEFYPQEISNNDNSLLRQIQRLFRFHAGGHRFKAIANEGAIVKASLLTPEAAYTGVSHITQSSINNFNEVILPHYSINRCWTTGRDPTVVPEFSTLGLRFDSFTYKPIIENSVNINAAFPTIGITEAWAGGETASFLTTRIPGLEYTYVGKNKTDTAITSFLMETTGSDVAYTTLTSAQLPPTGTTRIYRLGEENLIGADIIAIQLIWKNGPNAGTIFKTLYSTGLNHTAIEDQVMAIKDTDLEGYDLDLEVSWTTSADHSKSIQLTYFDIEDSPIYIVPGTVIPVETGDTICTLWTGETSARLASADPNTRIRGVEGSVEQQVNPFATLIAGHDDFTSFFLCNPPLSKLVEVN